MSDVIDNLENVGKEWVNDRTHELLFGTVCSRLGVISSFTIPRVNIATPRATTPKRLRMFNWYKEKV